MEREIGRRSDGAGDWAEVRGETEMVLVIRGRSKVRGGAGEGFGCAPEAPSARLRRSRREHGRRGCSRASRARAVNERGDERCE